jgi:ferrochelatase
MKPQKNGQTAAEAVLLLAHGTPDVLAEMDAYLELVTGGRRLSAEVVHELQERYAQIGLCDVPSPQGAHLTRWTFQVAALLERRLGQRVYVGMRNWKPFIRDIVEEMKRDGVRQVKAICMAPQNSRTSVGLFKRALENAVDGAMDVDFISGWADHPLLAKAFAQRMKAALENLRTAEDGRVAVLFTAHSVPSRTVQPSATPVEYHGMILANSPDTYETDCRQTAGLVAAELSGILDDRDWYFSFQSQGMSGGPWIGPTVEETMVFLKNEGYNTVVIQPVGFLSDHVEILYDIDIAFQGVAKGLGLKLVRAESLNDSPLLIDALEDLAVNSESHTLAVAG